MSSYGKRELSLESGSSPWSIALFASTAKALIVKSTNASWRPILVQRLDITVRKSMKIIWSELKKTTNMEMRIILEATMLKTHNPV